MRLAESVPEEARHDIESLCFLMSSCISDAVAALAMFEEAIPAIAADVVVSREAWERDCERSRQREAELEAERGLEWGDPDYFEKSQAIREQAQRDALRQKWAEQSAQEIHRHRLPFIYAQSFVVTLALLQRSLVALRGYDLEPHVSDAIQQASDQFANALPGLAGVRDSTAHAEDRVRRKVRNKTLAPGPVMSGGIHAPDGDVLITSHLHGSRFGCTIADGTFAEIDVSDPTTEVAQVAVQAVFDALPWQPGYRRIEPSQ